MHMNPQPLSEAARWKRLLAPYTRPDDRKAIAQLAVTATLFVALWLLMLKGYQLLGWWAPLPLAPFAGGLLIRLFIFQHDCGHGSFTTSRRFNDGLGFVLGVLTLTPYHWWKKNHAIHHGTSGDLDRRDIGDVTTLTVREYLDLPWHKRLGYRLYRNPLVMLVLGPIWLFAVKHRFPFDTPLAWRREWRDVLINNLVIALLLFAAAKTIGLQALLAVHGPIFAVSAIAGVWLFYVQHQFEDTVWSRSGEWDFFDAGLHGSSFYDLPAVLHWFTGNIGYHHVHHLASRIPNYELRRCFREVEELQQVPHLGLRQSLGCLRLKLWDEDAERMVGFGGLKRASGTSA
ncbi:MAG: fatty acid desaturase [Acidobacteria bacterium]|nr:MAG: fatty acid desaturase [Acidobacteriota bacterium]REK09285.1 MAG: fatty acid desaturase [Acidobacteriota bacterium]